MPGPMASTSTAGPQQATFSYFHFNPEVHEQEKAYEIIINLPSATSSPETYRRSNQEFEERATVIDDVRGREHEFQLDVQGACWRKWEGPLEWKNIDGESVIHLSHEQLAQGYLREAESFIKAEIERQDNIEVDKVKIFDYKLRLSMDKDDFEKRTIDLDNGLDAMIPVTHPHVDQSYEGAKKRVEYHMGSEAQELLTRRFRIVNLWRPLKPIKSWPLAVCDSTTVQTADLVPSDLVRRKFVGETFYSRYSPDHRWYYLSDQQTNEVTLLKIFDSDTNAQTRFCLHSAFQYVGVGADEVRESFEVRALVFDHAVE